ncbi:MAG TPA: DUF2784 domain-containing protein [Methylococcus sp.]|nr:DUF2784 domain-containing protein [Methylococcus sp.]
MIFGLLADLLVLIHFGFILFVLFGGFLVPRFPRLLAFHLGAVAWGVVAELRHWICPLTPWEQWLRARAGQAGYEGDFIERYLVSLIYPSGLTPRIQVLLGLSALTLNLGIYAWIIARHRRRHRP